MKPSFLVAAAVAACAPLGCTYLPRDGACLKAEACDAALEEPFGSFAADDAQFGDAGSCWVSADTAKPCVKACEDFVGEELADADADNDGVAEDPVKQQIVDACR